ncbi:MAG: Restriction modification system DNA specificity domain protein [Candidatus Roizmanbacteria bacterium GW2011_GWA2_35_19]|uniref:Restriction modification system DNA specificity domain protein n=2 Tax=Candidatus Roizmaniibacteriota TaxID=1752723 RepID=A0A0G0EBB7_9BACT|nr:MAG: Restriction modification system DNA specificity domain protein [Candidatus Roizmanbacteria bacterium GW2011_GWC2_35_12]KKP72540.1 MAG: Restriction modification system DNA specificity domain protein [Candidatus Roizmanbacteria bacterium GW2011_GWA2_35_19]
MYFKRFGFMGFLYMSKTNWQTKKLGEILKLEYGKPLPKNIRSNNGKYPVYGANGIKNFSDQFYYDKFSIIVGRKGSAGEINLTKEKFWPLDVTYFVTFDNKKYDLKFLYNLLDTLKLPKLAKGVKPGINRNEVYSIEVKTPTLSEQHRIIKKLDKVFGEIEKAKESTERNLQNSKDLFESYLQNIFEKSNDEWQEKKLGDKNLLQIIDGDRGKNYPKKSDFLKEGYCLFLNTKNVRPNGFDFKTTMFITKKKDDALGNGKLQRNDVLLTTRGTIGNIAVYGEDVPFKNIRINSGMLIFRPNTKLITPGYLYTIFQSGIMKFQIKKYVSGAAQPQLPIKTLVNFSIPVLKSLSEQKSIVKKLDELSEKTKRLEEIYKQKLADLEELKKSILKQAFEGKL